MVTNNESMQGLIIDANIDIKWTSKFKYLGSTITHDTSREKKIKNTRACRRKLHPIIWKRNIYKGTKHKAFKNYNYNDVRSGYLGDKHQD